METQKEIIKGDGDEDEEQHISFHDLSISFQFTSSPELVVDIYHDGDDFIIQATNKQNKISRFFSVGPEEYEGRYDLRVCLDEGNQVDDRQKTRHLGSMTSEEFIDMLVIIKDEFTIPKSGESFQETCLRFDNMFLCHLCEENFNKQ